MSDPTEAHSFTDRRGRNLCDRCDKYIGHKAHERRDGHICNQDGPCEDAQTVALLAALDDRNVHSAGDMERYDRQGLDLHRLTVGIHTWTMSDPTEALAAITFIDEMAVGDDRRAVLLADLADAGLSIVRSDELERLRAIEEAARAAVLDELEAAVWGMAATCHDGEGLRCEHVGNWPGVPGAAFDDGCNTDVDRAAVLALIAQHRETP